MDYKTLVLEMIEQRPTLDQQLRAARKMKAALDHFTRILKLLHELWCIQLAAAQPQSDPAQRAGAALELALDDLWEILPPGKSDADNLSPDKAWADFRRDSQPA